MWDSTKKERDPCLQELTILVLNTTEPSETLREMEAKFRGNKMFSFVIHT